MLFHGKSFIHVETVVWQMDKDAPWTKMQVHLGVLKNTDYEQSLGIFSHSVFKTFQTLQLWGLMSAVSFLLFNIIANHCVNHQLFADDAQQQKCTPLNEVTNLIKEFDACTDIKTWMTENQLKLDDDKAKALLFPFLSSLKHSTVSLPDLKAQTTSSSQILPGTLD